MGKLGRDIKDLLIGNDGSDKEANDFKTELQEAIEKGIISKSEWTLLITARIKADELGEKIIKSQEKDVTLAKEGKVFDSPEEELEYRKKKEEERRKKEKEAEMVKMQMQNISKKKNGVGGSTSKGRPLSDEEIENMEEKRENR